MLSENKASRSASPKILHLVEYEKFIPSFIDLIAQNYSSRNHQFFMFAKGHRYGLKSTVRVLKNSDYDNFLSFLFSLIREMNKAEKIILHGLYSSLIIFLLFIQPWLLPRCYWVIWGGDLYTFKFGMRNWQWRLKEFFRKRIIKKIGYLISYVQGDIELARDWYGASGLYLECFMYPSNLYYQENTQIIHEDVITIQIGNSADPGNEHFEMLNILEKFRDMPIRIIAPLSYGDREYASKVAGYGSSIFGGKFIALFDFLEFEDYRKLQNSIDIAIFNHDRQQAMGNIIALLGMGKKVYLRESASHYTTFKNLGLDIFVVSDLNLDGEISKPILKNIEIIKKYFSKNMLLMQLNKIFTH